MRILLLATMGCLILGPALHCLRRALLDSVRQDLYRVRERLFDRILSGEMNFADAEVRQITTFIHGALHALNDWSVIEMVERLIQIGWTGGPPSWVLDPRLKNEAQRVSIAAVRGVFHASFLVRVFMSLAVAISFAVRATARFDAWKNAVVLNLFGAPPPQARTA